MPKCANPTIIKNCSVLLVHQESKRISENSKIIKIDRSSPSDTLAQLVERSASNAKVPGLNPGWSVIFSLTSFMLCGRIV